MEADSFSLKLTLSVLAKEDRASCPSWMNLSSTPMYLFCRAMLSRLASASCRAFSFVSFSLRASTRLHASVISGSCQMAFQRAFKSLYISISVVLYFFALASSSFA